MYSCGFEESKSKGYNFDIPIFEEANTPVCNEGIFFFGGIGIGRNSTALRTSHRIMLYKVECSLKNQDCATLDPKPPRWEPLQPVYKSELREG